MIPVIIELRKTQWADVTVLATAQHREMLDQVLEFFCVSPDIDLNIMSPNQSLTSLTSKLLGELDTIFQSSKPDVVLAQGDTTTAMVTSLAAFYHRIPFGHIEAGLRSHDIWSPFPEEANRLIATRLSRWHFAPTETSKLNLLRENIRESDILVTGNTVIDALLMAAEKTLPLNVSLNASKRLILVTAHRRENFGEPIRNICLALREIAESNVDVEILFPVHPNPNVKTTAHQILGDCPNVILCVPLEYATFIAAMKRSYFIISDSGGVQEEAPALGKPVLVLREETERPEALAMGVVKLVGSDKNRIVSEAQTLLSNDNAYRAMARGVSPYGDGQAAQRIVSCLASSFSFH
ncbi:MAG: UDP-N-acetylglucosamine 2-epimerase (non-hydrolyzing) [Proteobacteria bacterium]|nr:MAG: UDP-N-acetylglucosamine 2-epimerase (non-hydrolyzing) [Pseudomonadota bacterium]